MLRGLLRRGAFDFDEAVRGADRMTVAVTLFALLELYKRGEATGSRARASARSPCTRPSPRRLPARSRWRGGASAGHAG